MRTAQTQRQTVERADVFARMCVVEPVGARHGLAGGGGGASEKM
jgi:hypothetical protein